MNYKKVNQELAKEFGKGQVEVRKAKPGDPWEYTLWFLSDNPPSATVKKAKKIVHRFEPTRWLDHLKFHSEK